MPKGYEQQFNNLTLAVLTEHERQLLHKSLGRYLKNKDVAKFALTVREICNTPEKFRLLDYIRGYMTKSDKNQFDKLTGYQNQEYIASMTANARPNFFGRITIPPSNVLPSASERLITIHGSRGESMGFSVRGGSEFGLGIYVSNVKHRTPSAEAGLQAGDHIITVNGVDFHCIANSSAVRVLSNSATLNLIVIRCGKIPEWKVARERVLWFDVSLCRIVSNPPASETSEHHSSFVERKVVITIGKKPDFIGLNIRGGTEYGIGIYVSRVDAGGLAAKVGLAAGDQIVRVNEINFLAVTHSDAVDVLRSSTHLFITIRSVGKYPVFKELYAEYTWSDTNSLSTTTSTVLVHNRLVTGPGDGSTGKFSHRTRTRESSIDISPLSVTRVGADNTINSSDLDDDIDELGDSVDVKSQVCYPGDKDIMFRRNYEDTWQEIDDLSDNYATADDITRSWSADKIDSLGHYRQDSDNSDHIIDYTTFLEHASLKDEEMRTNNQHMKTSSLLRDENVVIETVIEEKITSFSSKPRASTSSGSDVFISDSSNQVYAQVQDLTGKTRPSQRRASTSSSVQSDPIYATVNKRSSVGGKDSSKVSDAIGNGSYDGSSRKNHESDTDETSLKGAIESQIERLEARKSHLGSWEITRVAEGSSPSNSSSSGSYESQDKTKTGTWTSLKNKLKGSLKIKGSVHKKRSSMPSADAYSGNGPTSPPGSLQQKGVFERSFGSQILNTSSSERYNLMGLLEDHARVVLTEDEYKAVLRHIHNYHENKQLDRLVELLLAILDKKEKKRLLVDVRNIIAPSHIARYDSLIQQCNIDSYNEGLTKFNSAEEQIQTHPSKSANSVDSHGQSKSHGVNNHSQNSAENIIAFSRKDFENYPGSLEVVVLEKDKTENRKSLVVGDGEEIVYISKHKTFLGLEICGGRNNSGDQSIRIKQIIAGGAASDDKRLQPGIQITKVDGNSFQGLSCEEARSLLQIAFSMKIPVNLGIQIRRS